MPFMRPALTVGPGAHAAPDARHWVVAALKEVGREDLVESAELAISELVGNAFLHGSDPITISMRGDASRPRIEVHDGSTAVPELPRPFMIDHLSVGGRGLALVARASLAWGVTLDDEGKLVWFEPAPDLTEGEGAEAELADLRKSAD
ncbi:ATP-binding protein [Nocardioides sp. Kera G14]|uniref:ATP-binding protein n=1 Tax=Nocardioides sp. Kera G14 TaxID=2884264 RepID=UPI001D11B374|nr:ATP-binding protein [Nocardioides sp. Kera G14]UDY24035.1 ATP-binding protein [Nocardioides sp. Kera G14]